MTQFRGIDPISDENWLMTKVKQNPEAFLVMAAGCALLLRSVGSRSREIGYDPNGRWSDRSRWEDMRDRTTATARSVAADLQDRVKGTAAAVSEKASDYATSLTDNATALSERAASYASNASDQATDWGRQAANETARMTARAQSSVQDGLGQLIKEQPFAVAALGVAVGAAVAAFLPPTKVERDALRPVSDAAANAVTSGVNQIKEAVSATGDQLKEAAQSRGLDADGIKDMAREASQAFTDKLAGSTPQQTPAISPRVGGSMHDQRT
jgi:hypothetical protein